MELFYQGRPLLIVEPEDAGNPSILVPDFDVNKKCKNLSISQIIVCCATRNDYVWIRTSCKGPLVVFMRNSG